MKFIILVSNLKEISPSVFSYSVTCKVNLFGKAFAQVRNCLRKVKHMYVTNKNIDENDTNMRISGPISTAISIKHRILATFNINTQKKI
jgi:hypothetical protein